MFGFVKRFLSAVLPKSGLGFVVEEFWDENLRGFGGFGMTVKNICEYVNSRYGDRARVYFTDVNSPLGYSKWIRKHDTDVLLRYKGGFFNRGLYFLRGITKLPSVFITVDFYETYLDAINMFPEIPVIVWIHDPRSKEDWEDISSVRLAVEFRGGGDLVRIAFNRGRSFRDFVSKSGRGSGKIIFATQGHCLVAKAESLFWNSRKKITAYFLPNPIFQPFIQGAQKSEQPTFVLLGRLDPIKRFWVFFELAKSFPNALFYVLGKSHNPELVEGIISSYRQVRNLVFLGKVEGHRKYEILASAWALLNTSIHEAIPVTFLESLSVGTPIISCVNPDDLVSKYGIHTEFVRGDGLDRRTIDSFKSAIEALLRHPEHFWEKASLGREYVRKVHSFENFERTLRDICEKEGVNLVL